EGRRTAPAAAENRVFPREFYRPLGRRRRAGRARPAALHAPDDQADGARGEQEERQAAEDDQRQRERRRTAGRAVLERDRDRPRGRLVAGQRRRRGGGRALLRARRGRGRLRGRRRDRRRRGGDRRRRRLRVLLVGDREPERSLDVVARARVDLHVRRQVLDRLLVAGDRVDRRDLAAVPLVQEQLPARRRRNSPRRCRDRQREGEGTEADGRQRTHSELRAERHEVGAEGKRDSGPCVCKASVDAAKRRLRAMLLSRRMEATRQLLSPLGPALALIAGAFFAGGGAGGGSLPWLGGAAVVVAAALVAAYGLPRAALALASVAWSIEPDRSWEYANRTFVYLAFALVGVYLAGRTGELALGLAALLGAVAAWALAAKALPWLYEDYGRIARLRSPVGYWNALALLGDVALPLGLWLAGRRRADGTLLVYAWIVALGLTYSRGGVAVALIVVGAWIILSGAWVSATTTLVAAGLPAAGVLALAFSLDGVTSDAQSHATRVHDGTTFGAAVLAGAVIAVLLSLLPRPEPTRALRTAAAGLVAVVAVIALAVAAAHAHTWWKQFTSSATPEVTNAQSRFVQAGSNHRWVWWKQA